MGNPETPKNGTGIKFAKAMSIELRPLKVIEEKGVILGRNYSIHNLKSKVGQPFRSGNFFFALSDQGYLKSSTVDVITALIDLGAYFDLITRSGAWYEFGEVRSQGMEKFAAALAASPALIEELRRKVYANF